MAFWPFTDVGMLLMLALIACPVAGIILGTLLDIYD